MITGFQFHVVRSSEDNICPKW